MALSLKQLPWYGQLAPSVVRSAAAPAPSGTSTSRPRGPQMATRQQQLADLRHEMAKGQNIARKLPEFRAQVAELETQARGPAGRAARAEGRRRPAATHPDAGHAVEPRDPRRSSRRRSRSKQVHAEWPISLELDGTYHDLALFFDKVSKVPRIINVSDIDVKGTDDRPPGRRPATGPRSRPSASPPRSCSSRTGPPRRQPPRPRAPPLPPRAAAGAKPVTATCTRTATSARPARGRHARWPPPAGGDGHRGRSARGRLAAAGRPAVAQPCRPRRRATPTTRRAAAIPSSACCNRGVGDDRSRLGPKASAGCPSTESPSGASSQNRGTYVAMLEAPEKQDLHRADRRQAVRRHGKAVTRRRGGVRAAGQRSAVARQAA